VVIDTNLPKRWDRNHKGQLGYEDALNRGDNVNEMGNYLLTIDLGTRNSQAIYERLALACTILNYDIIKC